MAIITFCSNDMKETGQTLSLAAIASYMAIEHNHKILIISTSFNDLSLENCFWEYEKIKPNNTSKGNNKVELESGLEGLITALEAGRTNGDIVKNYSRIVLRDRLDILLSPKTKSYQEYAEIAQYYSNILQVAKKYYDLIFVDLCKKMPQKYMTNILQLSDLVVMNMTQRLKTINDFVTLRNSNDFYKRNNVMLMIGKYDKSSKYNQKNITRYIKEKRLISVVPYNTLLFEACSEGNIIDFLLKIRKITDKMDCNNEFINAIETIKDQIIFKLQELQMKM